MFPRKLFLHLDPINWAWATPIPAIKRRVFRSGYPSKILYFNGLTLFYGPVARFFHDPVRATGYITAMKTVHVDPIAAA